MKITIDIIKKKYGLITDKKSFRQELAVELGLSFDYLTMNLFQKNWNIHPERFELINNRLDERISEQIAELQKI